MKKLVLKRQSDTPSEKTYRIPYAQELNEAQLQAVMHTTGPALVLAGAGTGKTRTLTYRVARLVEDGVDPKNILLLTFTRKAATEMLSRAGALLDGRCEKVTGGTFHSFGFRLLNRFGRGLGVSPAVNSISVLDQTDAQDVIHLVRSKVLGAGVQRRFPRASTLSSMISKSVSTMIPLSEVLASEFPAYADYAETIQQIVQMYHVYKNDHGLIDYDDLLLYTLSAAKHPEIGAVLRRRFNYLMVDEYQDTNALQHAIIMGLAGTDGNVMAVGDDAQSIYAFRGADVKNIHSYPNSFSNCTIIRLEQNYRSTQPILDLANAVLHDAADLFPKQLYSEKIEAEKPMLIACANERQQSDFVVQQILEYLDQGISLSSMAVLFRSSFLSFDLEIALAKANIPFRKVGGMKFLEAAHIKDILALARITENPRDALAWYRSLLLLPKVGSRTADAFLTEILEHANPLESSMNGSSMKGRTAMTELLAMLKAAAAVSQTELRMSLLLSWYKPLLELKYDDAAKRWKDIETIRAICAQYQSMTRFLADVAIEPPNHTMEMVQDDDDDDVLTLSTIHSAKGLEWHAVFAISVNDGHLPSSRSIGIRSELEEERRLLHVACTRAKEHLLLTYNMVAFEGERSNVIGEKSRFLETIDKEICHLYILAMDDPGEAETSDQAALLLPPSHTSSSDDHVIG